jgi:hypothetical protein
VRGYGGSLPLQAAQRPAARVEARSRWGTTPSRATFRGCQVTSEPTIDVLPSLDEIEELSIMVRLAGIAEPSHITWTEAELRFPSTRRSVVMILRGIALKLEQEQPRGEAARDRGGSCPRRGVLHEEQERGRSPRARGGLLVARRLRDGRYRLLRAGVGGPLASSRARREGVPLHEDDGVPAVDALVDAILNDRVPLFEQSHPVPDITTSCLGIGEGV